MSRLMSVSWRSLTALVLCLSWALSAQAAGVADATKWLKQQQQSNGSWGGAASSAGAMETTSVVLEALASTGQLGTQGAKAWTYLQSTKPTTASGFARRIIAAVAVGQKPLAADVSAMIKFQTKGGGFAPFTNHQATTLDTALALIALGVSSNQSLAAAKAGVNYLTGRQRKDGSWGFFDKANDPSPYLTGLAMLALSHYQKLYNLNTFLTNAAAFYKGKQATDGSWGVGRDRILDTSVSILGLIASGQQQATLLSKAVAYLAKQQAQDGSFASKDPFVTAYALRALDSERADLFAQASEVTTTPNLLVLGKDLQVKVKVRNQGNKEAKSVVVRLYLGDPSASGQKVDEKSVATLGIGASSDVTLTWKGAKPIGPQYLYIVLDPDKKISELNERNNTIVWGTRVLPPVDLAIATRDIVLKPTFPSPGKTVEINATVYNKGGIEAKQVEVAFYNGDPQSGGKLIGTTQTIASIAPGKFGEVKVTTPPLPQGKTSVFVVVDPNNKTNDTITTNNKAKKEFSVQPRMDLVIAPQGLFFSKNSVLEGQDIKIRVGVYNAEATTATDAVVRLYDGDPLNGGKQIGTDVKLTVPGYKAVYTPDFVYKTFGKAGSHLIYAVVDPDNKLPDIQRTNNVALRTVKVQGLPDLSVTSSAFLFSPAVPFESNSFRVYVTITNKGKTDSQSGTKLYFYDTDPSQSGAKPFYTTTLGVVRAGSTTRPSVTWSTYKKVGVRTFWVKIDPDQTSLDRDRTNNIASKSVTIRDSTYPDMYLSSSDISFSPAEPQAGTSITITAKIHNRYRRPITNVLVRFHDGSPTSTNQIGETTVTQIAGYGNTSTSIKWNVPPLRSSATIYVVIDPLNRIRETTTGNNRASRYTNFRLSQGTAPKNLTVTNVGTSDLRFQWQAGSSASSAAIQGYRLYCNEGLLNPPTRITGVTAKASDEISTTRTAATTVDSKTNTFWEPKTTTSPTLEWTLPKVEEVQIIQFYLYSTYTRTFEFQAFVNNQWVQVRKLTNTRAEYHNWFLDKPIVTNKFRVVFSTSRTYYARTREVAFFRPNLAKGTTYTHTKFYPGTYKCYAVSVTTPLLASPKSNEVTAQVGDTKPPGVPTQVSAYYNPSLYENRVSWNGVTDSDLEGYQVYHNTNPNVATNLRGAAVYGPAVTRPGYYFIDNNTSYYYYIASSENVTVKFRKNYSIHEIRVYLRTTSKYSYRLDYSTDGKTFTTLGTKTSVSGLQVHKLPQPLNIRYVRVQPLSSGNFYMSEVQALTKDFALASTLSIYNWRRFFTRRFGTSHWYSYWNGYNTDYKTSTVAARQFLVRNLDMGPLNTLSIIDLDTGQVLASVSGQQNIWRSPWLRAKNYRVRAFGPRDGYQFHVETIVTRKNLTTPTFGHPNIYNNGTYKYAVSAVDQLGNESGLSSSGTSAVNDTTGPNAPYSLRATVTNSRVNLSWYARSTRDRKGYIVYRDGKKIAETTSASYADTNVKNGVTYSYEVTAVDFNGNESSKAGPIKATPTAIDLTFNKQGAFGDIVLSPRNPSVYESVLVVSMVRNIGTQDAPTGVEVGLYDGNPKSGGTQIGIYKLSKGVLAGQGTVGSLDWKLSSVKPGKRTIYVVIDPNNKVPELSKTNNTGTVEITIHADPYLATFVNKVDSSKFPVVDVFMSVKDSNGGGLFGLDERNFKVWEDAVREIPIKVTQLTQPTKKIPKADLAFVIDTSCSMLDEWRTVCQVIDDIRDLLLASRIDTKVTVYGLAAQMQCGSRLSTVIWRGNSKTAHSEDWGPGGTWASLKHPWRTDAVRIVIPISDEGAYAGNSWSSTDTEAVNEMIKAAKSKNVIYYPFWGKEVSSTNIIATSMQRAAKDTGGEAFPFNNATQVVQAIVRGVLRSISDYKITYTTHNKARDGTLRKVKVDTNFNISKGTATGDYTAPLDKYADLLFEGGIQTVPDPMVPSQAGSLVMNIRNNGGQPALNVVLRMSVGDPASGGLVFAESKIPRINPGAVQRVTIPWKALPGASKIVAVIDPDNKIQESNETNNRAEADLKLPGARGTDLAVTSFGLSMAPFPSVRGDKVDLKANIYNIGTSDVTNVLVAFFRGDPQKGGKALGTTTVAKIEKGKSAVAKLSYTLLQEGNFELYVVVDPYDDIAESSEDNNKANRNLKVDLRGLSLSIATDKPSYPIQTDATITVKVKNNTGKPWNGRGEVWIVDAKDQPVEKVGDLTAKDLPNAALNGWAYQIPVNWTAPASGTKHYFLGIDVDFTQALVQAGQTNETLNPQSIRLLWLDPVKKDYAPVPFKFIKGKGFDAKTKAQGRLLAFLKDPIKAGTKILFYVFFDKVGGTSPSSPKALPIPETGWQIAYAGDSGRLYYRERKADGTWAPEVYIHDINTSTDYTRALGLGDFNGDGIADLIATTYRNGGQIFFYPGSASSTKRFDPTTRKQIGTFGSSYTPLSMKVGDINNDGKLDFVFGRYYYVYWMLGNGDGTFQTIKSYRMPSSLYRPYAIELIDYDKDGNKDVLVYTYYDGRIYFLKGDGKGSFATAKLLYNTPYSNAYGFAVADFNQDGNLDFLVNNTNRGDSFLITNNGKGGWNTPVSVPSLDTNNYTAWALADWNYDGIPDLFAATYTTRKVLLYTGNGKGYTASANLNTGSYNFLGIAVGSPTAQSTVTAGKGEPTPFKEWTFKWNTKLTPAGPYHARVQLLESAGVIAEAKAKFAVEPEIKARAELSTDRLAYPANAPVSFVSRIFNDSKNVTYDTLKCKITITDAQKKQVDVLSFTMSNVLMSKFQDRALGWSTKVYPPGKYTATLVVDYLGKELAKAITNFDILTSANSGIGLLGTLNVTPGLAQVGDALNITFDVLNIGNQPFTNHEVKVRIFSDTDRKEKDTISEKLNLPVQKNQKFSKTYDSKKLTKGDYTVMLTTKLGAQEFALDVATLQLRETVQRPPLTVKVTAPKQDDKITSPVLALRGEVSDGDATVEVNGVVATVTGSSTKASNFDIPRLNVSSCEVSLEAKANRGPDTAKDQVNLKLAGNPVVLKDTKALQSSLKTPGGIAAGAKGSLLVTDPDKGTITRLELDGQQKVTKETEVGKDLKSPGAVFESSDGTLYVAETSDNNIAQIKGGTKSNWLGAPDGLVQPSAFAEDDKGSIYVASAGNGKIFRVDKNQKVEVFSSDFQQPVGLAYNAKEGLLYVLDKADGQLYTLAKKDEKPKSVAGSLPGEAGGLAKVGDWLIASDTKDNALYVADLKSKTFKIVAGLLKGAAALATLGKDGLALATDGQGIVLGQIIKLACVAEAEPNNEPQDEPDNPSDASVAEKQADENMQFEKLVFDRGQVNERTIETGTTQEEEPEELLAPKGCGCNTESSPMATLGFFLFLGLFFGAFRLRRRRRLSLE